MKYLLAILCQISFLAPLFAQSTKILTADKHNEYGLVYTLPITAFEIEVTAVKEVRMAGPFYKYAKRFVGDEKAVPQNGVNWSIESIKVRSYGVPDTETKYLMQLKPGATTFISVADDGMLLSINKETKLPEIKETPIVPIEGEPTTGREYLEFVNEDFTAATSSFKQAQILADELMEIRDSRLSLTRGTAETMPTDGRQLELMLQSLEKQEKALMRAFNGNIWKERVVRKFTYIPEDDSRRILFRLDNVKGPVGASEKSGKPVYVSLDVVEEMEMPKDAKGEDKRIPKDAVIYCIPGSAELNIYSEDKKYFAKSFELSQYGVVFGLSPSLFTDKKDPSFAVFNPATGALVEIGSANNITE